MTHQEIAQREIVESYSRGKLSDTDSQAFEEHFFTCDLCFAEVQAAGKFIAGVRHAAAAGRLTEARRWEPPFGLAWAAAAALMVATAWIGFVELPKGRRELERQRAAFEEERGRNRALESQLALAPPPAAEANLPLAMLEASRAGQTNEVTLPPGASRLVLWIELDPGVRFSKYSMQIRNQAGITLETIDALTKNAQGALAAGVPASRLPAGTYTVLLHGDGPGQGVLIAEYRLAVHR